MQDTRRYYGLDALRGTMMMLGIVIHGAMYYLSGPLGRVRYPTDPSTSYVFDLAAHFIHSFRMPLFFMLSGFFASLLVERRGLSGALINRTKRILAPLLISMVTVLPAALLFMMAFLTSARFNTQQLLPSAEQLDILLKEMAAVGVPNEPMLLHLWFLAYLLYFYLAIPLCITLIRWSRSFQAEVERWLATPAMILGFAACTAATLWPHGGGVVIEGVGYLIPEARVLSYYGIFFVLGYLLHHNRRILETFKNSPVWCGPAVLFLFPASLYAARLDLAAPEPSLLLHGAAVLLHALCTWALIYGITGLFLRYLDRASPWVLYTSQSSYWVYLLHMPVISFAAWWILPFDLHAFIKFPLIVAFTVLVCFTSYHYLVQRTWISVLLNGRRFDLKWPWLERRQAER
jgi:glucan biosynthesis protein C